MRQKILTIIEVVVLILSVLWFVSQPSYEPLIAGVVALGALLGSHFKKEYQKKQSQRVRMHDEEANATPFNESSLMSNVVRADGSPPDILTAILSSEHKANASHQLNDTDIESLIESWVYHQQTAFYGKVIAYSNLDTTLGIPLGSSKKHLGAILEKHGYQTREGNASAYVVPLQELGG